MHQSSTAFFGGNASTANAHEQSSLAFPDESGYAAEEGRSNH